MNKPSSGSNSLSSIGSTGRNLGATALLILSIFAASCKDGDKTVSDLPPAATNQPITPPAQPQEEVEKHEYKKIPIMYKDITVGDAVYEYGYLKEAKTPTFASTMGSRVDEQHRAKEGNYVIFSTTNDHYVAFVKKNVAEDEKDNPSRFSCVRIAAENLRFLDGTYMIKTNNGVCELLHLVNTEGETPSANSLGEVTEYRSLEDDKISESQSVRGFQSAGYKGVVFLMKDGRKLYYRQDEIVPVKDVKFEDFKVEDKYSEGDEGSATKTEKYLMLKTINGHAMLDNSEITHYDQIQYTPKGKMLLIKNGNIVNAEFYGAKAFVKAIAENNLYESVANPNYKHSHGANASLEEKEEDARNKDIPYNIETNVTAKFKGFKIKYVGIEYGEGDTYSFSQDGKNYYTIDDPSTESGKVLVRKYTHADEIVTLNGLSKDMEMKHLLTGNYTDGEGSSMRYLGEEKGGLYTIQYTVEGLYGTTAVQSGAQAKNALEKKILEHPAGYEIVGYFMNNKPLKDEDKCPKGTVIIIKYKKIATTAKKA